MGSDAKARAARVASRCGNQDANLFLRLLAASTASSVQAQRLLKLTGELTITEWRILWDTVEAGPLSVQDIALIQRSDHSLISRALPAMRNKGYITTKRSAEDKRNSLVHVTAKGRRAYERSAPIMKARRRALAKAFTADEMETFLELITRFETHLVEARSSLEAPESHAESV